MTLNEEVAVEVMGWEKSDSQYYDGETWSDPENVYWSDGRAMVYTIKGWKPDEDLNQARMVTEKGVEILSEYTDNTYDTLGDCLD